MDTDSDSDLEDSFEETHIPDQDIQGVVLVQLLVLSQFNDESCSIYDHVYLQLTCAKFVKRTHVLPFFTHKEALIDSVKHFPVNIPVSRSALKNLNLKIEMIMYKANKDKTISIEKRQMGVMLFHLKDLMSKRIITGVHEFSKDMTSMAKLEIKICFSSGMFGFGYSRRINFEADSQNDEFPANIEDELLMSLFPRYKPPPDRVDESKGGILSVKEVPIPDILPMFHDPDDPVGDKFLYESRWTNHPCSSLMKDCARLRRLRLVLLSCDSHHLRKVFLEKLILNNEEMTFSEITGYKDQKEEDTDNLNILMKQAEKVGSMAEPGFVRRMSSSVNPQDLQNVLKETNTKMQATMFSKSKMNEMDESDESDASEEDIEQSIRSADDNSRRPAQSEGSIKSALDSRSRWAKVKRFTFQNKIVPESDDSDEK